MWLQRTSNSQSTVPMCGRATGVPRSPTDAGTTRWTILWAEDLTTEGEGLERS